MAAIGMAPNDNMEDRRNDILSKIKDVDTGHGVIVLTDMFGGTPSNLAISLLDKLPIEVVAGFNLPMLIKLCAARKTMDLKKTVQETQDAGKRYIHVASQILTGE
jgi:PTS system mannose-specific IIA component